MNSPSNSDSSRAASSAAARSASWLWGDVNEDGNVDAAGDEAVVDSLRYAVVNPSNPASVRSDVSVNGFIDDEDVVLYTAMPLNGASLILVEWPDPGF